jgi:hypothetical protein
MATVVHVKSARERRNPDGTTKPLNTCDRCSETIRLGMSYKHISIKTGPTTSRKLIRCDMCPTWHVWEYSNSVSARCAQIVHEAQEALGDVTTTDDVTDVLQTAADAARELAEEKREAAQNIEDGFGHATSQSDELTDLADQLEDWAASLEGATIPDYPDPNDAECPACDGTGTGGEDMDTCSECNGTKHPAEPTEDQLDEWRNELLEISELEDSPV